VFFGCGRGGGFGHVGILGGCQVVGQVEKLPMGQAAVFSVTLAEFEYGIQRRGSPTKLRNAPTQVMLHMDVLPWDAAAATCHGEQCSS